jgi:hypothetical protein
MEDNTVGIFTSYTFDKDLKETLLPARKTKPCGGWGSEEEKKKP